MLRPPALHVSFPGREALIARLFGLVHGLAFAATLDRLGLGLWGRVVGTLAFNMGVEAMQLLLIAAVLPSLLLVSSTSVYPVLRLSGALIAGTAAAAWLVERIWDVNIGVDAIVDVFARHLMWLTVFFFVGSLGCFALGPSQPLPDRRQRPRP